MKFVCIMGRSNSGKSTVEKTLENMGFKRSISYTTREPQVRNNELEKDGKQYHFVKRQKFNELVADGIILEYTEYNGNLYGTPRPHGATKYVAVVEFNGYTELKKIYGNQVIGVFLDCDADVALERGIKRDGSAKLVNARSTEDEALLEKMRDNSDIIINGNQDINKVIADILKKIRDTEED